MGGKALIEIILQLFGVLTPLHTLFQAILMVLKNCIFLVIIVNIYLVFVAFLEGGRIAEHMLTAVLRMKVCKIT